MFITDFVIAKIISKICRMRNICTIIHLGREVEIRPDSIHYQSANIYVKDLFMGKFTRQQLYPQNRIDKSYDKAISEKLKSMEVEFGSKMGCDIRKVNSVVRDR